MRRKGLIIAGIIAIIIMTSCNSNLDRACENQRNLEKTGTYWTRDISGNEYYFINHMPVSKDEFNLVFNK